MNVQPRLRASPSRARRQALDALERVVDLGYSDFEAMAADEDLASLRREERFKALVQR